MTICLLFEDHMKNPEDFGIKIVQNYGNVHVRFDHGSRRGQHIIVDGTEEQLKNWLFEYDGVAVGKGSPMLQEFDIMHIKGV